MPATIPRRQRSILYTVRSMVCIDIMGVKSALIFITIALVVTFTIWSKEPRFVHLVYDSGASIGTIMVSENTDKLQSNYDDWKRRQEERQQMIRDGCRGTPFLTELNFMVTQRKKLSQILVDDIHKALYCYIPKVSCSAWKRIWIILTGTTDDKDPDSIKKNPHSFTNKMKLINNEKTDAQLMHKLTAYKKFLVVRHPQERLVSAFRNKFKLNTTDSRNFKRNYGQKIKKKFRPNYSPSPNSLSESDLTFSEFISYVGRAKQPSSLNEHWRPYYDLCHPCIIRYDVIGKYETLTEDSEMFLREIGAPDTLHFPSYKPTNTSALLNTYYSTLTQAQIDDMLGVYQRDFQLFNYDPINVSLSSIKNHIHDTINSQRVGTKNRNPYETNDI